MLRVEIHRANQAQVFGISKLNKTWAMRNMTNYTHHWSVYRYDQYSPIPRQSIMNYEFSYLVSLKIVKVYGFYVVMYFFFKSTRVASLQLENKRSRTAHLHWTFLTNCCMNECSGIRSTLIRYKHLKRAYSIQLNIVWEIVFCMFSNPTRW